MSDSSVSIHIKNLVTMLVAGFAAVALFVWVHQESEGWVSLWSRRFAMGTTFIAALYVLADLLQIYMQIRRRRLAYLLGIQQRALTLCFAHQQHKAQ